MNELIDIETNVNVYFEVRNAEIYGGKGSVGYAKQSFRGCKNIDINNLNDSFIKRQEEIVAKTAKVQPEDVTAITKEEYERKTEDEQDEN